MCRFIKTMEWKRLGDEKYFKGIDMLERVITRILMGDNEVIKEDKEEKKKEEKKKWIESIIEVEVPAINQTMGTVEEERH